MTLFHIALISFSISLLLVIWIHPRLVQIALQKNIVDKPNARKLQHTAIPVLGGVAVFFGTMIGVGSMCTVVDSSRMLVVLTAMMAMLYVGTMDDIQGLSPRLRLLIEITIVFVLIFAGDFVINNLHGLWGIYAIPQQLAVPLTVFASVGIINAINLIDGVNGLSAGFCTLACMLFGTLFYLANDTTMLVLAAVSAGALIPFLIHNVFGKSSKMFIGDGGTLVMGVVMSIFVSEMLRTDSLCATHFKSDFGLVPFTLAVLAIPVFDTLRVMSSRIAHGVSPFRSDRTHLHHLFVSLGCSHPATMVIILLMNISIVLCWWLLVLFNISIDIQLYAVIGMNLLATFGLYNFLQWHLRHKTRLIRFIRHLGYHTHISRTGVFLWLQKNVDKV